MTGRKRVILNPVEGGYPSKAPGHTFTNTEQTSPPLAVSIPKIQPCHNRLSNAFIKTNAERLLEILEIYDY